jgi:hypothetical protein
MGALFTTLFAKVAAVVGWVGSLWVAIFAAAWNMLTDVFCWVVEQSLGVATSAMGALDTSGISTNLSAWGSIPADTLNVLGLLGVGQACTIITAAIGIRFALQLIPFTRLGS